MKYEEKKVSKETEFMGVWNAIKKIYGCYKS